MVELCARPGRSVCVEGAVHASRAPCMRRRRGWPLQKRYPALPVSLRLLSDLAAKTGLGMGCRLQRVRDSPPPWQSRMIIGRDARINRQHGADLLHSRFAPPGSGNWLSEATYGETAASIGLETLHSPLPSSIPILPFFNNGPNDQLFLAQGCRSAGQYCLLYWATL